VKTCLVILRVLMSPFTQKLSETVASTDYAYKAELADGLEVAKGIAEKVNETLRQHTNTGIVQELESRVKDWKGHHINDFGNLLLDGQFMVTKADMDRDYEVYLFEKMILCCKEVVPDKKDKKNSKSGSILKKDRSSQSVGSKKNMLNLKGRIYVNNLTHIQGVGSEGKQKFRAIIRFSKADLFTICVYRRLRTRCVLATARGSK
jgi:hypothetical protein